MPKLGVESQRLKPCPDKPNCVCSFEEQNAQGYIKPIDVPGGSDAQESLAKLVSVALAQPRVSLVSRNDVYAHLEFRSALFRFVDDVEFYIPSPDSKVIHVRSSSRVGHSDFGVNRKRIERLRSVL